MRFWTRVCWYLMGSVIAAAGTFPTAASAQDKPVANILVQMRTELEPDCRGKLEFFPGTIEMTDLNDDGRDDSIIDYDYVMCDGTPMGFCGAGGACRVDFWIDVGKERYVRSRSMLSKGLRTRKRNGRTLLMISVHGSECGKSGAEDCTMAAQFSGKNFRIISRR